MRSKRQRTEAKQPRAVVVLLIKTANAEGHERRPLGNGGGDILQRSFHCGLHGKGFPHPAQVSYQANSITLPPLLGHPFAYMCPTPRKQTRPCVRIRLATPALCSGSLGTAAGPFPAWLVCTPGAPGVSKSSPTPLFAGCLLLRRCGRLSTWLDLRALDQKYGHVSGHSIPRA